MATNKFTILAVALFALVLTGAGCNMDSLLNQIDSLPNQIKTQTNEFGKYKQNGEVKNGVDKYNDISIAAANTQYTGPNGNADAAIYSADSATVNQYMSDIIKDETGDKKGFTKMDVGNTSINYRSTNGKLCLFLWTSKGKMIMINDVECSAEDDLVSALLKKYPPSLQ